MRRPLPGTYPELEIRPNWPIYVEYRVNNWKLARDGSGRVRRGFGWSFWDITVVAVLVYLIIHPPIHFTVVVLVSLVYIRNKTYQLLWESVLVLPAYGLQLESHRGLSIPFSDITISLSSTRCFIPTDSIQDVLVNEGLRRWNWHYYLVILTRTLPFERGERIQKDGEPFHVKLLVAFEGILPHFEVVKEVYHGVREDLFGEFASSKEDVGSSTGVLHVQENRGALYDTQGNCE